MSLTGHCRVSSQWRHNECDDVSNRQSHDCLLNGLFRHGSKKTSKLRVTGLCEGNSPVTGEFPAQRDSNAENVSIWWRHHVQSCNPSFVSSYWHSFEDRSSNECQWLDLRMAPKNSSPVNGHQSDMPYLPSRLWRLNCQRPKWYKYPSFIILLFISFASQTYKTPSLLWLQFTISMVGLMSAT